MMIRERRKKANTVIEREKRGLRRFVTYSVGVCGADPHGQRVVRNDKTYFDNVFMAREERDGNLIRIKMHFA